MTCQEVIERLDAFVDGELHREPVLGVEIARHAAGCPACDTAIRELTALHEAIDRTVRTDVDALDLSGVWSAVESGIARVDARRAWQRRLRSAPMWGAAAMAMAAGALFYLRAAPEPQAPRQIARPNQAIIERLDTVGAFELRRDRKNGTTLIMVSADGEGMSR
jgi:anti-sigma factor RsiW